MSRQNSYLPAQCAGRAPRGQLARGVCAERAIKNPSFFNYVQSVLHSLNYVHIQGRPTGTAPPLNVGALGAYYFLVTIKARLLVKNKNNFQQKNVYLRDPPPGNGRPHYVFQLSDIGFIGKIFSLMVTSSHI